MAVTKRSRSAITRQAHQAGEGEAPNSRSTSGGRAVVDKLGREHMAEIGRKGAQSVARRYGLRFYSEIAARNKGVRKRRGVAEA